MKTARLSFLILTAALILKCAQATTVIPPSFEELVEQAQVVFQGTVVDVQSHWSGEGPQRRIVSDITFDMEELIKGEGGPAYTLTMLGGTVEGETLQVADAPQFKKGDHDILFVENNGSQFIPLVGIMHGRFRLQQDRASGRQVVTSNDGEPITDVAALGKQKSEQRRSVRSRVTLTPADFKAAIRAQLFANRR